MAMDDNRLPCTRAGCIISLAVSLIIYGIGYLIIRGIVALVAA